MEINIELCKSNNRDIVSGIMKEVFNRKLKVQETVDFLMYKTFNDNDNILFNKFKDSVVGEPFTLPTPVSGETISSIRKPSATANEMIFETTFSRDAVLKRHSHGDASEIIKVQEGDNPTDNVFTIITGSDATGDLKSHVLMSGEHILIPQGVPHQVSNAGKKESKLIVKLKKEC